MDVSIWPVPPVTCCNTDGPGNPFWMEWIFKPLVPAALADVVRMEDFLSGQECQDVDYTVVKPAVLTNGAKTGEANPTLSSYEMKCSNPQTISTYTRNAVPEKHFWLLCVWNESYSPQNK